MSEPAPPIFTIGYGAREMPAFLAVLQRYEIAYLLDVRSRPYSRYKPEFSKSSLEIFLSEAGIRYIFMGETLGGQPANSAYKNEDDKVDYLKLQEAPFYKKGIARVQEAQRQGLRVVLMCSEGKPENCHRSMLIGHTLQQAGVEVAHIDERDKLISQDTVKARENKGQPSLFSDEPARLLSKKRYVADEDGD